MSHKVTYITCCTDLDREKINHPSFGRQFASYETGFRKNLETHLPLIGYSSLPNMLIPSHRSSTNLRHYFWDKKIILNSLPEKDLYIEKYKDPKVYRDGIINYLDGYAALVLMKFKLIEDAIKDNPFNSEYFAWIDCQFTAGMKDNFSSVEVCEKFSEKLVERLSSKKFLLFRHSSSGLGTLWKFNLSKYTNNIVQQNYHTSVFGFFWGAHKDTILKLNDSYWNIYTQFLNDNIIPSEELILNIMTMKSPGEFDDNFIKTENYKDLIYKNVLNTSIK